MLTAVKNYSDAIAFIEQKMVEEGEDFNPDDYMHLLDVRTQAVYRLRTALDYKSLDGFLWPTEPMRGISAYFRDASYAAVFGVGHNAIDIPAYQRTPIRAAADGVVYVAKDNGYGYSYIILAHSNGFMTVYGHMNEILVEEGQIVPDGFVIGLSGGMPGTKGAGYMTTGPHLHFEVLHNGIHVDPMDYLNLSILAEEHVQLLPEKYKAKWEADVAIQQKKERGPLEREASEEEEDFDEMERVFREQVEDSVLQ